MSVTTGLLLLTLVLGVFRSLSDVAESSAGQIGTLVLLTLTTMLTLRQQIVEATATIEDEMQVRFLLEAAKPTPEFFHRLRVSAMAAFTSERLSLQEDRF